MLIAAFAADAADNFSLLALFGRADWIVKSVMLGLALSSVLSLWVVIDKHVELAGLKKRAKAVEDRLWGGASLEDFDDVGAEAKRDPVAAAFAPAAREWRDLKRQDRLTVAQTELALTRADRLVEGAIGREIARAERGLSILATIGSASPFIGLFGTVWGIVNAFRAIAERNDSSLITVAPGIAEALFATALGLFAAIPAVIFYNKLAADIGRYGARLDGIAEEFSARLSRRLSERTQ